MKKALIIMIALSFALSMSCMPAIASTGTTIGTGLTADTSGGTAPVVQAKWEAYALDVNTYSDAYTDASTAAGAQFNPSGVYQQNTQITLCAIVSDPDGLADVNHVYADVFYPTTIGVGPDHVKLDSQTGDDDAGCGDLMQEDELVGLSKLDGINLFCNEVRTKNANLPKLFDGYTYDAICKADGTLQKELAKVYCWNKEISYEDPSGTYVVKAVAVDKSGKNKVLANDFDYLPMTAFETDFTSIAYGKVRLETEKIINGDIQWATNDNSPDWVAGPLASVRNVGNTRAAISVNQDDMNFGKTGLNWNVYYKARIGNEESDWTTYNPDVTTLLKDELNLSEHDEIDFGIFVKKFPITEGEYSGDMTLSASFVEHCICGSTQNDPSCEMPIEE